IFCFQLESEVGKGIPDRCYWAGIPLGNQPLCARVSARFPASSLHNILFQKLADNRNDLPAMGFQREVPSIIEANVRIRKVTFPCQRACWQEKWIVLPPNRQQRWLILSEILLE